MFYNITIGDIGALLVFLVPFALLTGWLIQKLSRVIKTWHEQEARLAKLERQAAHRQGDTEMTFIALRGCLEAHVKKGANGNTAAALRTLNKYQAKKSAGFSGGKSKGE